MKTISKVLAFAGLLLTSGLALAQQPVVGVVNLEQALFNSQAAQELQAVIQEEFRDDQERVQGALQERNQSFIDSMRQNLGAAIQAVVQEGGYTLVLNADSVAFFDNVYDITGKVTAKLNELNQ